MRHGQSVWNKKNLFTGWVDIPLSEQGVQESIHGGKKIAHLPIDVAFTSSLIRAQMTLALALLHHASGKVPTFLHTDQRHAIHSEKTLASMLPVTIAWELNERMYGTLQGLNKQETAEQFGDEQVHRWRRSFDEAPPGGESLQMTAQRTVPYFHSAILPHLKAGRHVFVAAHGNSLRSIVMEIESLSPDEVVSLEIATGEPLIYSYEHGQWTKIPL
jgi:2,3-bisphosphoglycerate-dependent phosphoglycerate mutase